MSEWNGHDRRKSNRDHDMLTRIDANLSTFMKQFDEHGIEDNKHFDRIYPLIGSLRAYMFKSAGIAIGASIVFGGIPTIILIVDFLKRR